MNLIAELHYPGWYLRNWSNGQKGGRHWTRIRKANQPPAEIVKLGTMGYVTAPHPRRRVEVLRVGPRKLDLGGLWSSIKPAVDRLKCSRWKDPQGKLHVGPGWLWDDSEEFCELVARQELGEYGVVVKVWDDL